MKELMLKAYSPYRREALRCFITDAVMCAVLVLLAGFMRIGMMGVLLKMILPLYFVAECLTRYRVALLSFVEAAISKTNTKDLHLARILTEARPGTKFGNFVPQMYDREANAQKYRLIFDTPDGKTVRLRSVMSEAKCSIMDSAAEPLFDSVTYGTLTRIIISYNGGSGSGLTEMF